MRDTTECPVMRLNLRQNGVSVKGFAFFCHPIADFSTFLIYVESTMKLSEGAPGFRLECCNSNIKAVQTIAGLIKVLVGGRGSLFIQTVCDPV